MISRHVPLTLHRTVFTGKIGHIWIQNKFLFTQKDQSKLFLSCFASERKSVTIVTDGQRPMTSLISVSFRRLCRSASDALNDNRVQTVLHSQLESESYYNLCDCLYNPL